MAPIYVDVVGESDVGLVRERNEDSMLMEDLSLAALPLTRTEHRLELGPAGALFGVLDGMGGAAGGDRASRLAADVFSQNLRSAAPKTRRDLAYAMRAAALEANRRIRREGAGDPQLFGMGTTLTAGAVVDSVLLLVHVGDSRAYLLRQGVLVQLTEDQSLIQELLATGQLRREDAALYEHSNVILQALGVAEELSPALAEVPLCRGDVLLLCSDGLTSMVPQEELHQLLSSKASDLTAAASGLTALARAHGGHDNITVVLARFDGEALPDPQGKDGAGELQAIDVQPLSLEPVRVSWRRRAGLTPVGLVLLAMIVILAVTAVILVIGLD